MKFSTKLAGLLLAVFSLSSCIQQDEKFTVNADGTTKFTVKVHLNTGKLNAAAKGLGGAGAPPSDLPTGKDLLLSVIATSEGVDVWSEAKFISDDGENIHATLVGYARDINRLKLGNAMQVLNNNKAKKPSEDKQADGAPVLGTTTLSRKVGTQWGLLLESPLSMPPLKKPAGFKAPRDLQDEAIAAKIAGEKLEFQIGLGLMGAVMKDMTMSREYKVAGTITDFGAFTKVDEQTATVQIETLKAAQTAFDVGTSDLKAVKESMKTTGKAGGAFRYVDQKKPDTNQALVRSLFNKQGKLQLMITPGHALFDFPTEAKQALADQSAELKMLLKEAALLKQKL